MKLTQWRFLPLLAVAAVLGLDSRPAAALPSTLAYTLFQDGYAGGATITGSFTGVDLDGNGLLIHFPSDTAPPAPIEFEELTALSIHFSGNALSPAFDLTLADVYGFAYEVGSSGLGDGLAFEPTLEVNLIEGIGVVGTAHYFTSGLGPNQILGGYIGGALADFGDPAESALDLSARLAQVTPVPEPAAGMLAAGMLLACARRRRG